MLAIASMRTHRLSDTSCPMNYRRYLLPGRSPSASSNDALVLLWQSDRTDEFLCKN
jgi:hypothetical protein